MKKLFETYEVLFCIALIVLYVAVNSFCMQNFGIGDWRSALVNTLFSIGLIALMMILKRTEYYGLKGIGNLKDYLYFLPLLLIVSVNLWSGIHINHTPLHTLFYILTMLNVGFIEEIVFRGFLFRMMAKDNLRTAILVSALTFGAGHIVNLLNGAELVPTLLQVCYAASIGYLFVIIFHRSGSLIPCIAAHSVNNALSVFSGENVLSRYVAPVFLMIVPLLYAFYIQKKGEAR